jgi:hypothetical protein
MRAKAKKGANQMIRILLLAVVLAAPLASAQVVVPVPPASPAARPAAPATKPSPAELHAQAYEFMRAERFDKSMPLLNRAYIQTPAAQRSRPLIFNRALLDLVQKANLPRGIKDLHQHLARNPAPDEQASNLLGSLLEFAAENPRWRSGPLYADAFREFARREAVLERHRPGFKRWGPKWITQEEFDEIKRKDKELQEQMAAQGEVVNRRSTIVNSLRQQYTTAAQRAVAFSNHVHVRRHNDPIVINPTPCARCVAMQEAQQSVTELAPELHAATAELRRAVDAYEALKKRVVRPQWPRRYDPLPPDAPPPQPPQHPAVQALGLPEPPGNAPAGAPAVAGAASLPPATRPSDLAR